MRKGKGEVDEKEKIKERLPLRTPPFAQPLPRLLLTLRLERLFRQFPQPLHCGTSQNILERRCAQNAFGGENCDVADGALG